MNKRVFIIALLLSVLLPQLLFAFFFEKEENTEQPIKEESKHALSLNLISVKIDDNIVEMDLETYVTGVVLGEMPASFESEALKAQAVATRTYTLRKVIKNGKHDDADVCANANCCQAFISINNYKGTKEELEKITRAVNETAGQVATYQGNLIEATYFSASGGKTEDAIAVWGTDVPYLQSVDSPGEEKSQYHEYQTVLTTHEFLELLGLPTSVSLTNIDIITTYTKGGSVDMLQLFGSSFTGTQIRAILKLPSAAFNIEVKGSNVLIDTRGNGHRVGMSQYGADAMALQGKTYDEILTHYYSGVQLEVLTQEQLNAIFDKEKKL